MFEFLFLKGHFHDTKEILQINFGWALLVKKSIIECPPPLRSLLNDEQVTPFPIYEERRCK